MCATFKLFFRLLKIIIYFHYSLFLWLLIPVCNPAGAAAAKMPWEQYYSPRVKHTAAVPTELSGTESLILRPQLLLMWFAPAFGFTKKKETCSLLFRKMKLCHVFEAIAVVCYSSWVPRVIFPYSGSSSAVGLLLVWKDFVTCKETLQLRSRLLLLKRRLGRWI